MLEPAHYSTSPTCSFPASTHPGGLYQERSNSCFPLSYKLQREDKQAQVSPGSPLKQRSPGELREMEGNLCALSWAQTNWRSAVQSSTGAKQLPERSYAPVPLTQWVSIRQRVGREQMQTSQLKIHPMQNSFSVQEHSQSPGQ